MKARKLIALILLSPCYLMLLANGATVYKKVDKQGVPIFSSQPASNAAAITVRDPVRYTPPRAQKNSQLIDKAKKIDTSTYYQQLQFTKPANEATIRHNAGTVEVVLHLLPPLRATDRLIISLDGQALNGPVVNYQGFELNNMDRGSHTLQAKIIDAHGVTLHHAAPVTFYLHRYSILSNPSPGS